MDWFAPLFHTKNFSVDRIPKLDGKVYIVTGGNTGIGKVTCLELAKQGAHVILACRNTKKGQEALDDIKKEVKDAKVDVMELDLSSMQSVRCMVYYTLIKLL
jgi:NAD(P)-dependent dehydrogenase (short-subunit alcohol dehydrogenase family)